MPARCWEEVIIELSALEQQIRTEHGRTASNLRWSRADQEERTAQGRIGFKGLEAKWVREIDPDGVLSGEELAKRLANKKRAHFSGMALSKAKKERDRLVREQRAALRAVKKKAPQVAGPSAATDEPAGETTTTQPVSTGQEPQ